MISFNDLVGMEVLTMTMVVAVMMTMIMTTMTYYIAIEWASARVPPTPLNRGGGAAGAG